MNIDRRRLLASLGFVGGCATALRGGESEDPFDALPSPVWRNARRNGLAMIRHPAPSGTRSSAILTPAGEPGEPLVVQAQVFAPDGITPASGVTVYAYNTDALGYYGNPDDEYPGQNPPRIYGWMKTGAAGEFRLRTIQPGRYPALRVPAHVHFTFWGGGYPPQWVDDLRFAGDSYLSPEDLAADRRLGEFAAIRPAALNSEGVLQCSIRFRLRRESNFGAG